MKAIILCVCVFLLGCDDQAICKDNVIYVKPYPGAGYYNKGREGCLPAPQPQEAAR